MLQILVDSNFFSLPVSVHLFLGVLQGKFPFGLFEGIGGSDVEIRSLSLELAGRKALLEAETLSAHLADPDCLRYRLDDVGRKVAETVC